MKNTCLGLSAGLLVSMVSMLHAGELIQYSPAPGRDTGRIYYYVPDGIDRTKPAPLLIFLHGGSTKTPDTAPENYFSESKKWLMPDIADAPFIVAAPSAPPASDGSRWNRDGVSKFIDATIAAAKRKFNIDSERVFLGGHSMGCYGAYHLGQILADRFAGVWTSAGAWWETDFRAFHGTPVYIQHGSRDCDPRREYWCGHSAPRRHQWCGVSFARAADELMSRYGVEHVYDEHDGGHSLSFPQAKAAMRRFFAWTTDKRRNPYAKKIALITPCGTRHPDVEKVLKSRWLELVEATEDEIGVDAIVLHGPDIARTDDDLRNQRYTLSKCHWDGSRIVAENRGGNRFGVEAENVKRFAIYLSPVMGDIEKPFIVELGGGRSVTAKAKPLSGDPDYAARLEIAVP
jgi:poly(3-hydroxybutyrate) depolymerase